MKKIILSIAIALSSQLIYAQTDLSLGDAIKIGLENNYGIQISRNLTEQASLRNTWGMAGALPSLTFNSTGFFNEELEMSKTNINAQATATINYTLFDGFSIRATKAQLENNASLTKGFEMIEIETTIQSIINSYYYVLLQQKMLELNKTIYDISSDRYERQKNANEIGTGGRYEFVLAQTDYLIDKTSYMTQQVTLASAIRSFNLLLNAPLENVWNLTDQFDVPTDDYELAAMKDMMLANNTNLKNQYLNLQSKEIEIKKMRSELYPSIGLNASMGLGVNKIDEVKTKFYRPQVGFNVSYTLFNGGKNRRNISIAKLDKEAENLRTEEIKLSLESELLTQFDTFTTYKHLASLENEKMAAAKVLLDLSEERYQAGSINSFNYREVQLSYLRSAISQLNSTLELIVANTELLRLTGGILGEEME